MHHFDRTAGQTEGHRPQRTGLGPVDQRVDLVVMKPFLEDAFNTHGLITSSGSVRRSSFPIQGALLPFVDEAHDQNAQEDHHRPEA
jgi:hypothetical protein